MIRFSVVFPTPDPLSLDGLPEVEKIRVSLTFRSFLHAPLMRILGAVPAQSKMGHLLDLAMEGAIHRYGLAAAPSYRQTAEISQRSPPHLPSPEVRAATPQPEQRELESAEPKPREPLLDVQRMGMSKDLLRNFLSPSNPAN